eukprot:4181877-Amphidinium_carterae.2
MYCAQGERPTARRSTISQKQLSKSAYPFSGEIGMQFCRRSEVGQAPCCDALSCWPARGTSPE